MFLSTSRSVGKQLILVNDQREHPSSSLPLMFLCPGNSTCVTDITKVLAFLKSGAAAPAFGIIIIIRVKSARFPECRGCSLCIRNNNNNSTTQGGKSELRANTLMSDPGASSVPPPIVSNTSPPTANEAVAAVTPEKEKPPRPAVPRSIPFCKRAFEESEVDTAQSRARPARELRPTHVSGTGLCACRCWQLQSAPPSTRCRAFSARRASTGSTSRRCTLIEQVAEQRRRQKLHVQSSPRAAPSCAASSLLSLPPCRKKTPPARPLLARRRLHVACLGSSRPAAAALVLRTEHAAQGRATCVY